MDSIFLSDRLVFTLLSGIAGLFFGSFASAVIYRVPRGEDFVAARSRCPSCKHELGVLDLVPIFSWLLQRGHCRYCGAKFGWRYILLELWVAVLFAWVAGVFGWGIESLVLMALAVGLVILIVIDFEHMIIPDGVNGTLFAISIVYQWVVGADWRQFVWMPLGMLGAALLLRWGMYWWKRREGLGLGDVKFFAVIGLLLPFSLIPAFLFLSGVIGIIIGLVWRVVKKNKMFPFGPALASALWLCLMWPEIGEWWNVSIESILR